MEPVDFAVKLLVVCERKEGIEDGSQNLEPEQLVEGYTCH